MKLSWITRSVLPLALFLSGHAVFAAPRQVPRLGPTMIWSWWHADQRPAFAVGFPSNGSAVFLTRAGPMMVGSIKGPALSGFDSRKLMAAGMRWFFRKAQAPKDPFQHIALPRALPGPHRLRPLLVPALSAISPHGRLLAATALDTSGPDKGREVVCIWRLDKPTAPVALPPVAIADGILSIAFSPHGRRLAIGSGNTNSGGICTIRAIPSGKRVAVKIPKCWPTGLAYLTENSLAVLDASRLLILRPKHSLRPFPGTALPVPQSFIAMQYLRGEGELVATIGDPVSRPSLGAYSISSRHFLVRHLHFRHSRFWMITAIAAAAEPRHVILALTTQTCGTVGFFCDVDTSTGRLTWRSPLMVGGCNSIAVSPDRRTALAGGALGATLWRLPAPEQK